MLVDSVCRKLSSNLLKQGVSGCQNMLDNKCARFLRQQLWPESEGQKRTDLVGSGHIHMIPHMIV